ncbi:MAG: GDP-mannose 4,6-dehydratase, partial [Oscillospiraceae bacterium]|nr:GDP-mannose 4,6-dehydratase [Oscillospiraceae bacterium]
MKTYLVTGGAGFIGSNFIHYMLRKHPDIRLINLDLLTYAGNLENLADIEKDERHTFVQGDIGDAMLVSGLFEKYPIDAVVNFAAESHVDRSIKDPGVFVRNNVSGTVNLLHCAKAAWQTVSQATASQATVSQGGDDHYRDGVKFLQVSTDEVYGSLGDTGFFTEDTPLCPHSPYSASKAGADMMVQAFADTFKLPVNITRCSNNYGPYQFP